MGKGLSFSGTYTYLELSAKLFRGALIGKFHCVDCACIIMFEHCGGIPMRTTPSTLAKFLLTTIIYPPRLGRGERELLYLCGARHSHRLQGGCHKWNHVNNHMDITLRLHVHC